MIFGSIKKGLKQTFGNKRMLFIFYGVNLLFGALIMYPVRSLLNSFACSTMMADRLAGRLDMDFLLEFILKQSGAFSMLVGLITVIALAYLFIELFLSGGAFSVFRDGGTWEAATFWGNSGKYFGRFFRLALWNIPVFLILYLIQYVPGWILRIQISDAAVFWNRVLRVIIGYAGIILSYAIFDYARIHTVMTDEHAMRKAIWRGIKFTFRRFLRTFSLASVIFLAGLVVLFIYNPIADSLHAPSWFVAILLVLLQQLYMIVRMSLKLTLYASQCELYQKLQPASVEPAAPAPAGDPGEAGLQPSAP